MALKGANQAGRKALGRGLAALMSPTAVKVDSGRSDNDRADRETASYKKFVEEPFESAETQPDEDITPSPSLLFSSHSERSEAPISRLPIDLLVRNEAQPRRHFSNEELEALADSIRSSGLLQPILVRKKEGALFEIVAGERRFRAAQIAGLEQVPVLVRDLGDKEAFEIAVIENVQRSDLNPIEEALAFHRLIEEFGSTQAEVAKTIGKDRVSVANAVRLLKLPPSVQDLLVSGDLTAGHGRALLMIDDAKRQISLAEKAVEQKLSVRATESLVSEALERHDSSGESSAKNRKKAIRSTKEINASAVEERLRRALGTKVRLVLNRDGKGEVRISFFSPAELENVLDRLKA